MTQHIVKLVRELHELYKLEQPRRSQAALADALGVPASYVNKWVNAGKTVSGDNAAKILALYQEKTGKSPGVPIDAIHNVKVVFQADPYIKEISSIMEKMTARQKQSVVSMVKSFAEMQGVSLNTSGT